MAKEVVGERRSLDRAFDEGFGVENDNESEEEGSDIPSWGGTRGWGKKKADRLIFLTADCRMELRFPRIFNLLDMHAV